MLHAPLADGFKVTAAEVGPSLGNGANKHAHELLGFPSYVVLVERECCSYEIHEERAQLQELARLGVPTAQYEAVGWARDVPMGPWDRGAGLYRAGLMRRYALGDRDHGKETALYSLLTEKTAEDTRKILSALEEHEVVVGDFQFLIGRDGSIVVNDPTYVAPESPEYSRWKWSVTRQMDDWAFAAEFVESVRRGRSERDPHYFWERMEEWRTTRRRSSVELTEQARSGNL